MFKQLPRTVVVAALILSVSSAYAIGIQARQAAGQKTAAGQRTQAMDQEYTRRILEATPDRRILTELVDHMPASSTVPSPLKVLGYVPGENSRVTYHKDIVSYYQALDKASARVTMWETGKTEEGRPMVALAVADEATIASLDWYKQITRKLTDPRALTEAQARQFDLFKGRSQLIVQHFMFAPDWNEGCKSCSFWADGFERMIPHLAARDTTLVAVSRAPLAKLDAFKARMGWTFDWFSSEGSDFNYDYGRLIHAGADKVGRQGLQFRHLRFRRRGSAGDQRVLSRRGGHRLPHLFLLRPRPRHDERRLSLSRFDPARPPRGGLALPDGLAAAARPVCAGGRRGGVLRT